MSRSFSYRVQVESRDSLPFTFKHWSDRLLEEDETFTHAGQSFRVREVVYVDPRSRELRVVPLGSVGDSAIDNARPLKLTGLILGNCLVLVLCLTFFAATAAGAGYGLYYAVTHHEELFPQEEKDPDPQPQPGCGYHPLDNC
jgi:hypothetical protein